MVLHLIIHARMAPLVTESDKHPTTRAPAPTDMKASTVKVRTQLFGLFCFLRINIETVADPEKKEGPKARKICRIHNFSGRSRIS